MAPNEIPCDNTMSYCLRSMDDDTARVREAVGTNEGTTDLAAGPDVTASECGTNSLGG